jgi:DNA polymerase III subunit delta'
VTQLAPSAAASIANIDEAAAISTLARSSSAESTLRRLSAVLACRTSLDANANPLLTVEALTLALRAG